MERAISKIIDDQVVSIRIAKEKAALRGARRDTVVWDVVRKAGNCPEMQILVGTLILLIAFVGCTNVFMNVNGGPHAAEIKIVTSTVTATATRTVTATATRTVTATVNLDLIAYDILVAHPKYSHGESHVTIHQRPKITAWGGVNNSHLDADYLVCITSFAPEHQAPKFLTDVRTRLLDSEDIRTDPHDPWRFIMQYGCKSAQIVEALIREHAKTGGR